MAEFAAVTLFVFFTAGHAAAQSWQPLQGQAAVRLPAALQGRVIGQPVLRCDDGAWTLHLDSIVVPTGRNGEFDAPARLVIDGSAFPTAAHPTPEGNELPVPGPAIPALKAGNRLTVEYQSGTGDFSATFSLSGSGRALDYAIGRCAGAQPAASKSAGGTAGDGNLTAADVRAQLIGKRLAWGDAGTVYLPNGRFEGVLSGRANNGTYRIEADGRLCWQSIVRGCFRFYREGGALWVKRDDPQSRSVLGRVTIQN